MSKIAWTDRTWNPWCGCTKVSTGCVNCYAEGWSLGRGRSVVKRDVWGPGKPRHRFKGWDKPLVWNRAAIKAGTRPRVFCGSLCDVFDQEVPPSWRHELLDLIESTPRLTWQLLSKRPERAAGIAFPSHVWVGASVENQAAHDLRIPDLARVNAPLRFLSCEPLLGPIDLDLTAIGWVIVGGESGPDRRPMDLAWLEAIVDQCRSAAVPVFVKQDAAPKEGKKGRIPDELWRIKEFPAPNRGAQAI